MGGALDVPGNVQHGGAPANTTAEWNLHVDPAAARAVLASGAPILLVPLDATNDVPLDAGLAAQLAAGDAPLARVVARILDSMRPLIDAGEAYAWDPLAAAALVEPGLLETRTLALDVRVQGREAGRTVVVADSPAHIEVAVTADAARFRVLFVNTLTAAR